MTAPTAKMIYATLRLPMTFVTIPLTTKHHAVTKPESGIQRNLLYQIPDARNRVGRDVVKFAEPPIPIPIIRIDR